MSARTKIVKAVVDLINTNLNGVTYTSNIYGKAKNKLKFWDEINQYPYMGIIGGTEFREYLPAGFKWGFLNIRIYIYVKNDSAAEQIEQFLEDIENLIDANNSLTYDTNKETVQMTILSIDTDEGLLHPIGVGEMQIQIRYDL